MNYLRGEIEFCVDNKIYILRPTFNAIAEIESATSRGFIELAKSLQSGELRVKEMLEIIFAGITSNSSNEPITKQELGNLIMTVGIEKTVIIVATFFKNALGDVE